MLKLLNFVFDFFMLCSCQLQHNFPCFSVVNHAGLVTDHPHRSCVLHLSFNYILHQVLVIAFFFLNPTFVLNVLSTNKNNLSFVILVFSLFLLLLITFHTT